MNKLNNIDLMEFITDELDRLGVDRKDFVIAMRKSLNIDDPEKDWTQHFNNWVNRGLPNKYHHAASWLLSELREPYQRVAGEISLPYELKFPDIRKPENSNNPYGITGETTPKFPNKDFPSIATNNDNKIEYRINQSHLEQAIDELDNDNPKWINLSNRRKARLLMTYYEDVIDGFEEKDKAS